MTNLEALQSLVNLDLQDLHLKTLLDNSVEPYADYTVENKDVIELCSAYVYQVELTHPDFSQSKLKITVNAEALTKRINAIFRKNGLTDQVQSYRPTIKIRTL